MEQVPGKTIKIQTADGSLFVYQISDVEKITKETLQRPTKISSSRKQPKTKSVIDWTPKYRGEVNVGYAITGNRFRWGAEYTDSAGEEDYTYPDSKDAKELVTVFSHPLFETIHGVDIGPYLFIGAGIGAQYYYGKTKSAREWLDIGVSDKNIARWDAVILPIFADFKFMYPVNKNFTPYLNLGLGGTVGCCSSFDGYAKETEEIRVDGYDEYLESYSSLKTRGGFYFDLGVGFRYKLLNFSMGFQHQTFKMVNSVKEDYYFDRKDDFDAELSIFTRINSFCVRVGVNF